VNLSTILIGILVLNLLILIHELGHFLAARAVGMATPEFSVGMGPRLFSFRLGGTAFIVRLVPLAGYVLLPDLANEEGHTNVSALRRTAVMLAGPLFNLLFAMVLVGPGQVLMLLAHWYASMADLFAGSEAQISGLVGMSDAVGKAVLTSWSYFSTLIAYLSINFCIFNLLPFPGLDGGRLVGLLVEWLSGGRRPRWEPIAQGIGLLVVVGAGLWLAGQEILRVIGWIS
jgi:regulator of sigma E protease